MVGAGKGTTKMVVYSWGCSMMGLEHMVMPRHGY